MSRIRSSLFGQLVLQTGLVTREQIEECLDVQEQFREAGKRVPRLGELMAQRKLLTVEQVKTLLRQQKQAERKKREEQEKSKPSATGAQDRMVFGNYAVAQRLGQDASGTTFKARHQDTGTTVILRVLSRAMAEDPSYVKRFEEYARRASQLNHPNILRILTAGSHHGRLFYTTEYVQGLSLRRLLQTRGQIEVEFALDIAEAVTNALEYGHARGIFHQELSPSHIIILPNKTVKLTGFGSVPDPIRNLQQLTATVGETSFYVAPEQAADDASDFADARTDIYSLGAVLYHALSGKPPYQGESVEEVLLHIAEEDLIPLNMLVTDLVAPVNDLVMSMLAPDPDSRPMSASKLLEALEEVRATITLEGETEAYGPGDAGLDMQEIDPPAGSDTTVALPHDTPKKRRPTGPVRAATGSAAAVSSSALKRTGAGTRTRAERGTGSGKRRPKSRARQHASKEGISPAAIVICVVVAIGVIAGLIYFIPKALEQQEQLERERRAALRELEEKERNQKAATSFAAEKEKQEPKPASKPPAPKPKPQPKPAPKSEPAAQKPAPPPEDDGTTIYNAETGEYEKVDLPPAPEPRPTNRPLTEAERRQAREESRREATRRKLEGINLDDEP